MDRAPAFTKKAPAWKPEIANFLENNMVRKGGLEPSRPPVLQELPMILRLQILQTLTKSMG